MNATNKTSPPKTVDEQETPPVDHHVDTVDMLMFEAELCVQNQSNECPPKN